MLRVIWRGLWSLMLTTRPDDEPEDLDDQGLSTGDHVPPRDTASPIGRHGRDNDSRGPGR